MMSAFVRWSAGKELVPIGDQRRPSLSTPPCSKTPLGFGRWSWRIFTQLILSIFCASYYCIENLINNNYYCISFSCVDLYIWPRTLLEQGVDESAFVNPFLLRLPNILVSRVRTVYWDICEIGRTHKIRKKTTHAPCLETFSSTADYLSHPQLSFSNPHSFEQPHVSS